MISLRARYISISLACWLACVFAPTRLSAADVVTYRCALAIDSVIAELDSQAENPITQLALARIDEDSGVFVCVRADANTLYVRLQAPDMKPGENKLVFKIDASTYQVLKTTYGP